VEGRRPEGPDADWVHLPDPIADALKALSARIVAIERMVDELAGEARTDDGSLQDGSPAEPSSALGAPEARSLGPNPAGG
jgi:serine O-acetyltransferase